MTETMKVNLDRTYTSLRIVSTIAGVIIGAFVIYMNVDSRMDRIEQEQATTKGVQQEWMRNMEINVERIYDVVKEWERE
jgi:hypothetical protein